MNKVMLQKKMVEVGDNQKKLASFLGISESQISKLLNNYVEWDVPKIRKVASKYSLTGEEIVHIFLT